MIPAGWKQELAIDLCSQISVGIVVKPAAYYVDEASGVRAFRSANVGEGFVKDRDWIYISGEGHRTNRKSVLQTNDVLIVRTGYPGTACLVPPEYAGSNCIDIIFARPKPDRIIPSYLCVFTNSEYGKKQVLDGQGGLAQQHFNVGAFKEIKIPLPPLPEQRRIAEILSTWDRAIETVEALIANARAQKKALMRSLLTGKQRLPGFSGAWSTGTFGALLDLRIGGTPSRNDDTLWDHGRQTNNHWIAISDLSGKYLEETKERISDTGVKRSNVKLLPVGTVVMSFKLSIGRKAILRHPAYTNEAICALIPKASSGLESLFVYHAIEAIDLEEMVDQAVKGKTLNKAKIAELRLRYPCRDEQKAIVDVLESEDRNIEVCQANLSSLGQEKSALMQQLLTGKRRVRVDAECAA